MRLYLIMIDFSYTSGFVSCIHLMILLNILIDIFNMKIDIMFILHLISNKTHLLRCQNMISILNMFNLLHLLIYFIFI